MYIIMETMGIANYLINLIHVNIEIINNYLQLLILLVPLLIVSIKYIRSFGAEERLYITTYGQVNSPVDEMKVYNHKKHFNLIDFFINKVFRKNEYGQYFIILADSGMGKSTFLKMLFLKYNRKLIKDKKIYLYPLSNKKDLEDIKSIENKNESIILLDALDEDFYAVENYEKRMNEII